MHIFGELKYSPHHLWVKLEEGDVAAIGISDHAQELLGDIVYVEAPAVGANLLADAVCGVVESVKTASDLYAPLSGTVEAVNPVLKNTPELINEAPYEVWIFKMRVKNTVEIRQLMDAEDYRKFLANA